MIELNKPQVMESKGECEELSRIVVRGLQIEDDFVWVENTRQEIKDGREIEDIDTRKVVVAQYEVNGTNSNKIEEIQTADTDGNVERSNQCSGILQDLDDELLKEQQFWKVIVPLSKKASSLKSKNAPSQRMTLRQLKIIENTKTIIRHPSSYQFDRSTTNILEMLLDKKLTGSFHNIAGTGQKSVVVFADCLLSSWVHFPSGHAIKVYKLGRDVIKNKMILKRAQREFDVLKLLRHVHYGYLPYAVHKFRNVIVMGFIGDDQETAPSITSLPFELSEQLYNTIVNLIDMWYHKHKIIHGNLSTKNVRYWRNAPQFLGWSHYVHRDHPKALKKLLRDCCFVTKFFKERGVLVKTVEELFKSISGVDSLNRSLLEVMHDGGLWQGDHLTNPNRTSGDSKQQRTLRFKC